MTFCLGVKTADGLVGLSDRRITFGSEIISKKKVSVYQSKERAIFVMTAGLRSVRDKAITYFEEVLESPDNQFDKLFQVVNVLGSKIKKVREEDEQMLIRAGFIFNLTAIVGGQLQGDDEHKLYLLYSEGNWVEISEGSPFIIIGNSNFGKPILYRNLQYTTPLQEALKLGFLAFDSTRVSVNDVDFPIDVLIYEKNSFNLREHAYSKHDLEHISYQWNALLRESVMKLPVNWLDPIIRKR